MSARSELMVALKRVKDTGRTVAEVACLFGINRPRMSDLMRGKIGLLSQHPMAGRCRSKAPFSAQAAESTALEAGQGTGSSVT